MAKYSVLSSKKHGGPGPGAQVHIPLFAGPTARVRLTEGELKADIATALTGTLTLSVPGVTVWRPVLPVLERLRAQEVLLAFDADAARNHDVARNLQSAAAALSAAGLEVGLEVWDEADGKGIDDLLVTGKTPDILSGAAMRKRLSDVSKQALARKGPGVKVMGRAGCRPVTLTEALAPPVAGNGGDDPPAPPPEDPPRETEDRRLHLTDIGNAERLVRRHGKDLRFCHEWEKWLIWNGKQWRIDRTGEIFRRAMETVRSIYAEAAAVAVDDDLLADNKDAKAVRGAIAVWANKSEARDRVVAMINLAKNIDGIPITSDQLDADPWLLNCDNGTVDLRCGELRKHQRADLITKISPARYEPDARAPVFERFLERVLPDAEVRRFVQRAVGYSSTGDVGEEALFMPYGSGRNGKSKLLGAVEYTLGDYAQSARPETFLTKRGDAIPNDVAALVGVRFVATRESDDGKRMDVQLIKQMTGGDTMQARFMRAEFFTFKFVGKVWFAVNHKPVIRDTTDSIWERVKLIPFTVYIPAEERDKNLEAKLKAEADGILRWVVDGCLEWIQDGLSEPEAVTSATVGYRAEMDFLAEFFAQHCVFEPTATEWSEHLYNRYKPWAEQHGEKVLSARDFGSKLKERGMEPARGTGGRRYWVGVKLLPGDADDEAQDGLFAAAEAECRVTPAGQVTQTDTQSVPTSDVVTRSDPGFQVSTVPRSHVCDEPVSNVTLSHSRHLEYSEPSDVEDGGQARQWYQT